MSSLSFSVHSLYFLLEMGHAVSAKSLCDISHALISNDRSTFPEEIYCLPSLFSFYTLSPCLWLVSVGLQVASGPPTLVCTELSLSLYIHLIPSFSFLVVYGYCGGLGVVPVLDFSRL